MPYNLSDPQSNGVSISISPTPNRRVSDKQLGERAAMNEEMFEGWADKVNLRLANC